MTNLESRLERLGFERRHIDACIEALGRDVGLDTAAHWIALRTLREIFTAAGIREVRS